MLEEKGNGVLLRGLFRKPLDKKPRSLSHRAQGWFFVLFRALQGRRSATGETPQTAQCPEVRPQTRPSTLGNPAVPPHAARLPAPIPRIWISTSRRRGGAGGKLSLPIPKPAARAFNSLPSLLGDGAHRALLGAPSAFLWVPESTPEPLPPPTLRRARLPGS